MLLTAGVTGLTYLRGTRIQYLVGDYVFRLRAFLALGHFHRDLLSFLKGFEAFHLDGGMVDKYVLAAFALDKAKSLVVIKPLDGSCNSFA